MFAAALTIGQAWVLKTFSVELQAQVDSALDLRAALQRPLPLEAAKAFCVATDKTLPTKACRLNLQTRQGDAWVDTCKRPLRGHANRYWRVQLICTTPSWFGTLRIQRERFIELLD